MTKTISLADDAYELMAAAKQPQESFSALARRVFGRPRGTLTDLAGAWSDIPPKEIDEMVRAIYRSRDEDRPNYWEHNDPA